MLCVHEYMLKIFVIGEKNMLLLTRIKNKNNYLNNTFCLSLYSVSVLYFLNYLNVNLFICLAPNLYTYRAL